MTNIQKNNPWFIRSYESLNGAVFFYGVVSSNSCQCTIKSIIGYIISTYNPVHYIAMNLKYGIQIKNPEPSNPEYEAPAVAKEIFKIKCRNHVNTQV